METVRLRVYINSSDGGYQPFPNPLGTILGKAFVEVRDATLGL